MAIYTKNGLKIRLDPDRLEKVLAPAKGEIDLQDAYLDIELWAIFPGAVSSVAVIATAFFTHSWVIACLSAILGYFAANLLQQFAYSRLLKVIFPQFFGGWVISLPISIAVAYYLYRQGNIAAGITQLAFVVANWWGMTDFLLFVFMPIRVMAKKLAGIKIGDIELAFIRILNSKARDIGIELNWGLYDEKET